MASFVPRATFAVPPTLPRSYYLGHHAAALTRMSALLPGVDLVLECRDFRAPLTSANPLLARALAAGSTTGSGPRRRRRVVVYTKRDLGAQGREGQRAEAALRARLTQTEDGDDAFFFTATGSGRNRHSNGRALLDLVRAHAAGRFSVTGTRVLVAGMPNVGKSTVLNALRGASRVPGARKAKVAATGGMPGVTRSVGSPVKILEGWEVDGLASAPVASIEETKGVAAARSEPVYVYDTPGVFMPYVPSGRAMLTLALCGAVKEGLVAPPALADWLLFHANRADPGAYAGLLPAGAGPTNDVRALLEGVARRNGKVARGGEADLEAAAVWFVQRWRRGLVGRFMLDDVHDPDADDHRAGLRNEAGDLVSINQARKAEKERRREKTRARRLQQHDNL